MPTSPPGFGQCARCPFLGDAPSGLCLRCVTRSMPAQAPARCCDACGHELLEGSGCLNPVCGWVDRKFEWARGLWPHRDEMRRAMRRYKEAGHLAWALVFGRLLLAALEADARRFSRFEIIMAAPAYVGPGGRAWDPVGLLFGCAARAGAGAWPFTRDVMARVAPSRQLHRCSSWSERLEVARTELRPALRVTDPERVRGRSVLVCDDILTSGLTLNETARCLRRAGATRVCGLALARQPWPGR